MELAFSSVFPTGPHYFTPLITRSSSCSAFQLKVRALLPSAVSGCERLSDAQAAEDGESGTAGAHHQGKCGGGGQAVSCLPPATLLLCYYRKNQQILWFVCVCPGYAAVPACLPAAEPQQRRIAQQTGPFTAGESYSAGMKSNMV